MSDINDFEEERTCQFKDETYRVRDNGAVMRLPKDGKTRPSDNKWTFGKQDKNSGYMFFNSSTRVHQIVATAFHGPAEGERTVVDHIDTNRANNRAENLRWVTRLENVLLNETTKARIIHRCGSIEAFLENPKMMDAFKSEVPNIDWMRPVSKEEAANVLARLKELSSSSKTGNHKPLGEWIYEQPAPRLTVEEMMKEAAEKRAEYIRKFETDIAENIHETVGDIYSYNGIWGYVIDVDRKGKPKLLMAVDFDSTYIGPFNSNIDYWGAPLVPTWDQAMEIGQKFKEKGWHLPTKDELDTFAKVKFTVNRKALSNSIDNVLKVKEPKNLYEYNYFMWSCEEKNSNQAFLYDTFKKETSPNPKDLSYWHKYNGRVRAFCTIDDSSLLSVVDQNEITKYATAIKEEEEAIRQRREQERREILTKSGIANLN